MTWKTEMRLSAVDPHRELEITCKVCGKHRYEIAHELISQGRLGHLYIDELEKVFSCRDKHCGGPVRIAITYDDLNEGFVGGMA